jgi:hypothetical protein
MANTCKLAYNGNKPYARFFRILDHLGSNMYQENAQKRQIRQAQEDY